VDIDKSKTPADNDVLTFDGTHWNAEVSSGGGGGGDPEVFVQDAEPSDPGQDALWVDTDASAITDVLVTDTSFPGSPATGDRFRRSDINYMIFFYDGTRWLSEQLFTMTVSKDNISATTNPVMNSPTIEGLDTWVERVSASFFVNGTNDGSNYWKFIIKKQTGAGGTSAIGAEVSTATHSGSSWLQDEVAIDVAATYATATVFKLTHEKNGSPGNLFSGATVYTRLIAT
jgi:hypothetical protein